MGILKNIRGLISSDLPDGRGVSNWDQVDDVADPPYQGSHEYTIPSIFVPCGGTAIPYISLYGTALEWPSVVYRPWLETRVTCKFCGVKQDRKDKCEYCGAGLE